MKHSHPNPLQVDYACPACRQIARDERAAVLAAEHPPELPLDDPQPTLFDGDDTT
jgi:hypothetical protein